jgi:hypothetical protein
MCPTCDAIKKMLGEYSDPSILCPICRGTAHNMRSPNRKARRRDDDEDDDEDDRRDDQSRASTGADVATAAGAAAGAAGLGIGMILLIVGGVLTCCVCVPMGTMLAIILPAMQNVREAAEKNQNRARDAAANAQAVNNFKEVVLGQNAHHDVHNGLASPKAPPQMPGGRQPELSWRVSVLPFIGQQALFNQVRRDLDWDHPANQPFLKQQPTAYLNSKRQQVNQQPQETFLQVFTGPNTLFPLPTSKPRLMEITDGTSNTFLFAEAQTAVPWTKPADMIVPVNGPLPLPNDRFIAAFADGSVRVINRATANDALLRLAIDPRDNQALPAGWGD